jgi:hypothetical protein
MIGRFLLLAIVALLYLDSHVVSANFISGADLLQHCTHGLSDDLAEDRLIDLAACFGFMSAVGQMADICLAGGTDIQQAVRAFVAYANRHRDALNGPALVIAHAATRDAFPCARPRE